MKSFKILSMLTISFGLVPFLATAEEMKMNANQMGGMGKSSMQGGSAPGNARNGDYSDGYTYRDMAGWEKTDTISFSKVIADQTEYRFNNHGNNTLRYDLQGWQGTDYHKVWVKLEGSDELKTRAGETELQVLYSRAAAPFWDFQIGARYDNSYSPSINNSRFLGVIGFQGLAPYWFDLEPALFISDKGDVSARITGTYDLLFTQRLILQPRLEINAALTNVPQFGVTKGVNNVLLGLRLRYEITREFAPYIGIAQQSNFAGKGGTVINNVSLIAGLRWWF